MIHVVSLGMVLVGLWLLLSGIYEPLLISLGVASSVLVVIVAHRMDVIDREAVPLHLNLKILGYWGWLAKEITKANIDVAKLILSPELPISPLVIRVKATQRSDMGRVIHANSITLTPGTVAMDFDGEDIIVHAISREAAAGTLEGSIDRNVTAVEER
ncbi:MAG TPA: Na+/H+ antiporter subunit E [Kiloniellaceae bacterium]|nr:Na+/H+ antiporter subunit E [Kiloniellaceae bacterium]